MKTWLTTTLDIKLPIIMAPMFLVSNTEMLIAAANNGIIGCLPALNYRTPEEFDAALTLLDKETSGQYGINLIANKSNIKLNSQLEILMAHNPKFIITSLGNPKEIITKAHSKNILVFCDVVDDIFAKKVETLGADAIIGVNSGAGGHAGPIPASILIPLLKKSCSIPVISAGGIASGEALLSMLTLGAEGVSMGTPFIAADESPVNKEYKQAIVDYRAADIGLTSKLSGTPCTIIKTPYVKKIGLDQNFIEKFVNQNKQLKKYAKMLTYYKGTKLLETAAMGTSHKTVWCAGPSLEFIQKTSSVQEMLEEFERDFDIALKQWQNKLTNA